MAEKSRVNHEIARTDRQTVDEMADVLSAIALLLRACSYSGDRQKEGEERFSDVPRIWARGGGAP